MNKLKRKIIAIFSELLRQLCKDVIQEEKENLKKEFANDLREDFVENLKGGVVEELKDGFENDFKIRFVQEFKEKFEVEFRDKFEVEFKEKFEAEFKETFANEFKEDFVKTVAQSQEAFVNQIFSQREYEQRLFRIEENLRQNNAVLENLKKNTLAEIDYFDFENAFRGPRDTIKESQRKYVPYFQGKTNVTDMGCGRGEFLELLKEAGVDAIGVDLNDQFLEYCKQLGLNVIKEDAINYLWQQERVGGIFASQLIEHLDTDKMIEFCRLAYQKLDEGAYFILETPNPSSLAIFTHAFYIDPSHTKPVHPLTVKYILERAGFRKIDIIYTEDSRLPMELPELEGEGITNLEAFNAGIRQLNDVLYGSQDYAIIAMK